MAEELVYRLVLDGQDNTSSSPSNASRPRVTETEDEIVQAYTAARQRIRREDAAEQADQAYRALKRGLPINKIQDEDHQAKLDAWEAEQDRKRKEDQAAADKKDPMKMAAALLERQKFSEDVRLGMLAQQRGTTIDAERQREENDRIRDEANKALDEQEREAARQKKQAEEAQREAERQKREAQAQDPVFLAQQAIERQKLFEQTRLNVEAMKRGTTPEEIANEERIRAGAKRAADFTSTGAGVIGDALQGNAGGVLNKIAGLSPITGPIVSSLTGLIGTIKQYHEQMRPLLLQSARFSPEVMLGNIENKMAEIRQDIQISKEKGKQISEQEKQNAFFDRANKQADVDMATGGFIPWISREWNLLKLGLKNILSGAEAGKQAKELEKIDIHGNPLKLPNPMEFQADKLGQIPGIGNAAMPFQKPQPVLNPQMPGM